MDGDGFDFTNPASGVVFSLERRNQLAAQRIEQAKTASRVANVGIGLAGFLPFPGAGLASMIASILAQAKVIIPALTNDIGRIYLAAPGELDEVNVNYVAESTKQVSAIDVGTQFTTDVLAPIINDLLVETGILAAGSMIPIVGGFIALGNDVFVMPEITARVGRMTSLYYQNQARWLNDSQKETYDVAKGLGEDLAEIRKRPEIHSVLLKNVLDICEMLKELGKERIREILRSREIPDDLIDEALAAL